MAWEIILPIAASIIQGAIGQGMAARGAAQENQRQSEIARMRRQELQPIIERLRKARDYFGMEESLVRDFSRAADQMNAQSAQTGMTNAGSGGLDRNRSDLLGAMLAQLAQFKDQDDLQRQQLLAQLVGDASLYADAGAPIDVGQQTLWGALGGMAAGAGSALNAFISTEEGLNALRGLFASESSVPKLEMGAKAPLLGSRYGNVNKFTPLLPVSQPEPRQPRNPWPHPYMNRSTAPTARPAASGGGAGSYYYFTP